MAKKQEEQKRNIGLDVKEPSEKCDDKKCPFHGNILPRGRVFEGIVESAKMTRTAKIVWQRQYPIPKYERYEKRRTRIMAHNPPCIKANPGDLVKIMETRPLSKGKNFVIIEKIKEGAVIIAPEAPSEKKETKHKEAKQVKK